MVKLIINEAYVDLPEKYVFEVKKSHPISNGLENVYLAYSTDIELELTETNVSVFDYSFYKNSTKVHKRLPGFLIKNGVVMQVDVIVKSYTKKAIIIFLIESTSPAMRALINDEMMLDAMPYKDILAGTGRITELSDTSDFGFYSYNTQEYLFPSIPLSTLTTRVNSHFGLNIVLPSGINPKIFANQAKMFDIKNFTRFAKVNGFPEGITQLRLNGTLKTFSSTNLRGGIAYNTDVGFGFYVKEKKEIAMHFRGLLKLQTGMFLPATQIYIGTATEPLAIIGDFPGQENPPTTQFLIDQTVVLSVSYLEADTDKYIWLVWSQPLTGNFLSSLDFYIDYQYVDEVGKIIDIKPGNNYLFDCYKNLPKINVLKFYKTIALANGYTLEIAGNTITFKKLTDYFSIDNIFDASDYFIEFNKEEFTFLKYQRNNIRYGKDTPPYATIIVDDTTLEREGDWLIIDALPIDDDNVQLWDYSDTTDIKIREGIATTPFMGLDEVTYNSIAQYLDEAFVFTVKFNSFNITGQPLYIRQLNGVFLPTEIRNNTNEIITIKMLKL